jgi:hypothetical protein
MQARIAAMRGRCMRSCSCRTMSSCSAVRLEWTPSRCGGHSINAAILHTLHADPPRHNTYVGSFLGTPTNPVVQC